VYRAGPDGDVTRLWRDRRLFHWETYDVRDFDEWSESKRDKEETVPFTVQNFWRPASLSQHAYDTLDDVGMIGATTETGHCLHCGGRRTRPACSCDDHVQAHRISKAKTAAAA
jgi:hypothetical protein